MLAHKLVGRKLSNKLNITTTELYSGKENFTLNDPLYYSALKHLETLSRYNIFYVDVPGTVEEIEEVIDRFDTHVAKGRGIIVFLDHVLLVNGKEGDMERRILFDLMSMENRQKKLKKITFVNLCQLNREIENVERRITPDLHYPTKRDIFGADAMYQFSDVVLITHRPEMLNIKNYGPNGIPTEGRIFWHFIKIREGDPFIAIMKNDLKHNSVTDWTQ